MIRELSCRPLNPALTWNSIERSMSESSAPTKDQAGFCAANSGVGGPACSLLALIFSAMQGNLAPECYAMIGATE
jgi:hypothetical protein